MQLQRIRRWALMAVLVTALIMGGLALSSFAKVQAIPAGVAGTDCRVALVVSRQEAEAAGVDWTTAKELQRYWSSTYRCSDEIAKMAALQSASEAKQRFLASR